MKFDSLEPIREDVEIGGKQYVLTEASEKAAIRWRNHAVRAAKMRDGKVVAMGDVAEMSVLLVQLCLTEKTTGKMVPLGVLESWPSRVVKALFERAKTISDLGEVEDAAAIRKQIVELEEKLEELEPDPTSPSPSSSESQSVSSWDGMDR